MNGSISRITIDQYLPIIEEIYASLEMQILPNPDMEQRDKLHIYSVERQYDLAKVLHAMSLIKIWLQNSDFTINNAIFFKTDRSVSWQDMLSIIQRKIMEYRNEVAVIELTLSQAGRITRVVNGTELTHTFEGDENMKVDIIRTLARNGRFLQTSSIQKAVKSKSTESIGKLIPKINKTIGLKLSLPIAHSLIETVRNKGSRIDPLYNVILIR